MSESRSPGDDVAVRRALSAQRRAELALESARARLRILDPLVSQMYERIGEMEASRFWRFRNGWFEFKKKLGLNAFGASQPFIMPALPPVAAPETESYQLWLAANMPDEPALERMRAASFELPYRPKFSIIMPTYNTPERFLQEALESVIAQVYPQWELCVADDASSQPHVRMLLEQYAARDERIRVVYRTENGHISHASNSALAIATGDFVALLDHDDLLMPDALYQNALLLNAEPDLDMIYSDEDKIDEDGLRRDAFFKPDWSPDSFLSRMYTCHLGVYRRSLIAEIGGFRTDFNGSQDYDLVLRFTERTGRIGHIPRILYTWRMHGSSAAGNSDAKPYAAIAGKRALVEALERRREPGRVEDVEGYPGNFIVRYEIADAQKVSVIIPTRDHGADVDRCLKSVFTLTAYPNFEVLLVDNGSTDPASLATFEKWQALEPERLRVLPYNVPFNYSKINNYAASQALGKYILLLNNDTEVLTADWMTAMVEQAQRASVGAVGAKLLYANDTIQHAGVVIGLLGLAGHGHRLFPAESPGYFGALITVNNYSALTAACLMVRRTVFDEVGGLEENLTVAFNDVDFCLKVQKAGYNNVYLPHVVLYHLESQSRGDDLAPDKIERFKSEIALMEERWQTSTLVDPCYNRNLTLTGWDFSPRY
jgi:GT2 family glycosyltransferase